MTEMVRCELMYRVESIGGWDVPIVEFAESRMRLCTLVRGNIINSITENTAGQKDWKRWVTSEVKAVRGEGSWSETLQYTISLGMAFHPSNHGNRKVGGQAKLDVENFIKPVLDSVAAGLFCSDGTDPFTLQHWNYDDSNFRTLLIHRLPDTSHPREEGVAISVSAI